MSDASRRAAFRRCGGWWLIAALSTGCAGHRSPPPSADIDETLFRDAVRTLASDEFEGRAPGTPGEEKTVAFLVAQFKKLGLKPGNGESYVQQVPLLETSADPAASMSLSGQHAVWRLAYGKDMVLWTRREAPAPSIAQSPLVFVGYGIVAPEYRWDDYGNADLHGKTVVVLSGDPGHGLKDPRAFKGDAVTAYGRWNYKIDEAARHGADAVLLVHDARYAGYGWDTVVDSWSGPQYAQASGAADAHPAFEGWLSADAARRLFGQAGKDFDAASAAAAQPGFRPIPLGLTADAQMHVTARRISSANVMALLPGARRRKETVLYTSHWDGLGRLPSGAGSATLNGAVDDAAGVAGMLAVAQSLARTQPSADRSFLFVAFTGAEAGLLGSAYFLDNPTVSLRDTAGVLNLGLPHIGGPTRDVMIFGFGNSELEDYLRQASLLQGRVVRPDSTPALGLFFESDSFTFVQDGIPALYFAFGTDDTARGPAWGQTQLDDYRAHRYHQPGDTYSADWNVRGTLEDLRLYYEVGNQLARSRHFPRWYPNSEYRSGGPPGPADVQE